MAMANSRRPTHPFFPDPYLFDGTHTGTNDKKKDPPVGSVNWIARRWLALASPEHKRATAYVVTGEEVDDLNLPPRRHYSVPSSVAAALEEPPQRSSHRCATGVEVVAPPSCAL